MRRHIFLSISLFAILFSFNGCGASGDAKKTADAFFIALIDNRINDAINSLDVNTAAMEGIENQLKILSENDTNGKLLSAKKTIGFNTSIDNGITTVNLPYKLTYEKGELSFDVKIVNRGNGYKILSVL